MNNSQKTQLVSIGLPIWNGASTMRKSLDSLLSQTYSNIEIVISDNASTDETGEICQEYAKRDSRICYIRRKVNTGDKGGLLNFQFVAQEARGEYFMWAEDDNYWHPDFILKLKNILDNNPDYVMAMCSLGPCGKYRGYKFVDRYNITNLSNFELFYHIVVGGTGVKNRNKDTMLIFGLFRMEFFKKFVHKPLSSRPLMPACKSTERILLTEMALAGGKFYTMPDILFIKGQSPKERRKITKITQGGDGRRYSYWRYLIMLLSRILSSKHISIRNKLVFLGYYPKVVWEVKDFVFYRDIRSFQWGRETLYPSFRKIKRFLLRN